MEKKRICYLVSSLCNEGPVNVMYNIIKNIDFLKFEVSIITFVPEKETTRMHDFSKLPISIYQLSKNKFLNPISLYLRLKDTVNEIEPNVLHAHCPRSLYLMAFLPKKFIKIFTIHNYPNEFQIVLYGKIKGEIVILLDHIFTRWIKNGICCAPNIREDYLTNKGWDFKCIPNGSSMPVWKYNDDEKSKYRKESIQIDLAPFTLIGATTRSGLLTSPLRARFGINMHLEYYDMETLTKIVLRSANILNVKCELNAAREIASRSRGTPRIANALLRRVRDFAQVKGNGDIDKAIACFSLEALNIDRYGLDQIDNKLLTTIIDKFQGGPVGLTTIATALGEDPGTLEEVYEPFLIKEGFIKRTPRGREVTDLAYTHLGRSRVGEQGFLFD